MLRLASHLGAAPSIVRITLYEDGYLKGPAGISLCHQHLISTQAQIGGEYCQQRVATHLSDNSMRSRVP